MLIPVIITKMPLFTSPFIQSVILAGRQPTKETDPEAANHTRHSAAKARVAQHRPSVVLGARQFAKAHVIGGEQKRKEDQ